MCMLWSGMVGTAKSCVVCAVLGTAIVFPEKEAATLRKCRLSESFLHLQSR